jgi:hypothetical protein
VHYINEKVENIDVRQAALAHPGNSNPAQAYDRQLGNGVIGLFMNKSRL